MLRLEDLMLRHNFITTGGLSNVSLSMRLDKTRDKIGRGLEPLELRLEVLECLLFLCGEERKEDPENTKTESGTTRECTSSSVAPSRPEKEVEKC